MNILYICQWNIWRSQTAEAFTNHYTNHCAISAWIDNVGFKYDYKPYPPIINLLKSKYGINMSHQTVKPISPHLLHNIDKIILLCTQDECHNIIPDYVINFKNVQTNYIPDPNNLEPKNIDTIVADILDIVLTINQNT